MFIKNNQKSKTAISLFSVLIIPVFFSGVFASINPCKEAAVAPFSIEVWSVFDDTDVFRPLIAQFQEKYSYATVNYKKKDIVTYEKELIDALAAGRGPDVFVINNAWLPKHVDKLAAAPESLLTPAKVKEVFVDVVAQDFVDNDKVYALPLSVDTLALFYNKDLLNTEGIAQPPTTWAEFNSDVEKLTRKDAKNNILRAGAALGTSRNINRSTDILAMLMLQSGAKMVSDDKRTAAFDQGSYLTSGQSFNPGEQALTFYTNFANPQKKVYTWDQNQHYSLDAFVEGKVAMVFNYAYQIPSLRARAPHLNFETAPLPQISEEGLKMTYANYWGLAVSKTSPQAVGAWSFVTFLAGQESAKQYATATKRPVARRDLIDWQSSQVDVGLFAQQALIAKSWWQVDNAAVETIFAQLIDSVVISRQPARNALINAAQQVTVLMRKRMNAN